MQADDVTSTEDDRKVLKSLGIHDNTGVVGTLRGGVQAWVDDLERADVKVLVDLVGEVGIDDDTVDVLGVARAERGLAQFDVVVLLSLSLLDGGLGWSLSFLGRSGWHLK